ncbi:DUF1697 domain-containing protein [Actinacidiphila yanglinensis]|uniref:DUF1697 domain-containing protein n=1 Tax=Actinacidiphila yanglinensis TaxID=310779 RepID=UPI001F1E91B3|nr:DUF1697 domain-containing protein [Actinacidiphila yanglinensis]
MTKPSTSRSARTAGAADTAGSPAGSYVALLRGINVGGHSRVPMETLRGLLTDMGGTAVRTHLQSGNAVFTHGEEEDPQRLAAELEQRISDALGLIIACLVRTGPDLRRVVDANPFSMEGVDGSRFVVVFLSGPPPREKLATLDPAVYAPDEFRAGEREIYAHFPDSIRNSKLATRFTDRWLGLTATSRNWNTVVKLLEMSGA